MLQSLQQPHSSLAQTKAFCLWPMLGPSLFDSAAGAVRMTGCVTTGCVTTGTCCIMYAIRAETSRNKIDTKRHGLELFRTDSAYNKGKTRMTEMPIKYLSFCTGSS